MRTLEELRTVAGRPVRTTPFYAKHREIGATLFLSGDWARALEYNGLGAVAEHHACRERAGLFDVSSIGKIAIEGTSARKLLNRAVTSDITSLPAGRGVYTCLCNESGGILSDPIVYCRSETKFYVTTSSWGRNEIIKWLQSLGDDGVSINDRTVSSAYLAVQGPVARDVLTPLCPDVDLTTEALPYFGCVDGVVADVPTLLCRTGYTGELGYELNFSSEYGIHMWSAIMDAGKTHGLVPCGGLALQTLRLEKALLGYGWDITVENDPFEAGLGWTIKLNSPDFVGRDALSEVAKHPPVRRLVPIRFHGPIPVSAGDTVEVDGKVVGRLTSALFGPTVQNWIALALVDAQAAVAGTQVATASAGGGTVEAGAFYDPEGRRPRV